MNQETNKKEARASRSCGAETAMAAQSSTSSACAMSTHTSVTVSEGESEGSIEKAFEISVADAPKAKAAKNQKPRSAPATPAAKLARFRMAAKAAIFCLVSVMLYMCHKNFVATNSTVIAAIPVPIQIVLAVLIVYACVKLAILPLDILDRTMNICRRADTPKKEAAK